MKALILAGGFGTRLKDVVKDVPKPMALVEGKPFLEYQIKLLRKYDVDEVVLAVHYMADKIREYFNDSKARELGVRINYSEEEKPLGTGGAVKNAENYLKGSSGDSFLVLNGDTYFDLDIREFIRFHKRIDSKATIALAKISKDIEKYGRIMIEGNLITGFLEKSQSSGLLEGIINAGFYLFEPEIFEYIEAGRAISIEKEVFPRLVRERLLHGFCYDGYFVDIGRPETYEGFKKDVAGMNVRK